MKKLLVVPILLLSLFTQAETIQCKVVGVTDGDTIKCLTNDKKQIKVRLFQIDAPESGQAYGQKAKQALSDMIFNKTVTIDAVKKDRYKRTLGTIWLTLSYNSNQLDYSDALLLVNYEMIRQGYAWHYPFDKKNPEYIQIEKEAKKAKRGLWADKNPIPPWEYRKQ